MQLKGLGKGLVHVRQQARFRFRYRGTNTKGEPHIVEFKKEGWVVDNHLEPNMLLGNDFLSPYAATICYGNYTIAYPTLDF
jgi:hypothetical protein